MHRFQTENDFFGICMTLCDHKCPQSEELCDSCKQKALCPNIASFHGVSTTENKAHGAQMNINVALQACAWGNEVNVALAQAICQSGRELQQQCVPGVSASISCGEEGSKKAQTCATRTKTKNDLREDQFKQAGEGVTLSKEECPGHQLPWQRELAHCLKGQGLLLPLQ